MAGNALADRQLAAICEIAARLEEAATPYWLFGGWAVDFHAGHRTRPHSDVDIVVQLADRKRLRSVLTTAGFAEAPSPPSDAFAKFEHEGVTIEVTFIVERTDDGGGVTPGYEAWPWDAGSFGDDVVALEGCAARVVSAIGILAVKLGWTENLGEEPRAHDLLDIATLRTLLGDSSAPDADGGHTGTVEASAPQREDRDAQVHDDLQG